MKIKINYKKIVLVLAIILVSCFALNGVQAAVTTGSGTVGTEQGTTKLGKIAGTGLAAVKKLLEIIVGIPTSGIFATITVLINVLSVALFLVLNAIFDIAIADGTELFYTPMPDNIVFNRFSIFDANFINPAKNSFNYAINDIISNLYASFYTIAIAILIIAAMITGIKMALSSVASKKAQYKESALKWVSGFLVLICLRWIIAGIFYINETIVATLYGLTKNISIPIYPTDAIPIYGQALTNLIKGVASLWGGDGTPFYADGYFGIALSNLARSFGGDIIASIIGFIIMRSDANNNWLICKESFYVFAPWSNISSDSSGGYTYVFYWEKVRNFY